jgi:hypothetical protein
MQPHARWFPIAAKDTMTVATAETWDWDDGSLFGRIHMEGPRTVQHAHCHVDRAHTSGPMTLELWRNRGQGFGAGSSPGTMLLVATVSVGSTENDGATIGFTWVDAAYQTFQSGDYLHLQAVAKPSGAGWRAYIDIHFAPVSI